MLTSVRLSVGLSVLNTDGLQALSNGLGRLVHSKNTFPYKKTGLKFVSINLQKFSSATKANVILRVKDFDRIADSVYQGLQSPWQSGRARACSQTKPSSCFPFEDHLQMREEPQ